jgi:hypothetical protein
MSIKPLAAIAIIITGCSCNSGSNHNSKEIDTAINTESNKIESSIDRTILNPHPNDEFRKSVVPYITGEKDLKTIDIILTTLDRKGLTFCQFIQRLLQLDDSCYAAANRKFPSPAEQKELNKYVDKAITSAESKYVKSLNITKHSLEFAGALYGFDKHTRRFCGNF